MVPLLFFSYKGNIQFGEILFPLVNTWFLLLPIPPSRVFRKKYKPKRQNEMKKKTAKQAKIKPYTLPFCGYFNQFSSLTQSRTVLKSLSNTSFPSVAPANLPWLLPTNGNSKQPLATTASKLTKSIFLLNNIYNKQ